MNYDETNHHYICDYCSENISEAHNLELVTIGGRVAEKCSICDYTLYRTYEGGQGSDGGEEIDTIDCAEKYGTEYIWSDEYDACVIKFMIVDTSTK